MAYSFDLGARPRKQQTTRPLALALAAVAALVIQVKAPLYHEYLSFLEPPLLVTVYFSIMRRDPVQALMMGAVTGLAQDALSSNPLGLFGIVKTIVAYTAASLSLRVNSDSPLIRSAAVFGFYVLHQVLYWLLNSSLLGQPFNVNPVEAIFFGAMNSVVAVPLFQLLDRL